jgi:ADP-ribose pyrophosphatase YjhB (NUDIX family)
MAAGWWPPESLITESYGFCFTDDRRVVLLGSAGSGWTLPGDRVEAGELAIDTLVRAVAEQACARVIRFRYLACQQAWDPHASARSTSSYQAVWWARVELDEGDPHGEIGLRKLVAPDQVVPTLSCRAKVIVGQLLDMALAAERAYRAIHAT